MATYNGKEGVWRTVGGRRIFISNGEDLATAMKNSGKFKTGKATKRNYKPTTEELRKKIIEAGYKDFVAYGQVDKLASETTAKMPNGTVIDVKENNSYHDTHSIYTKTGEDKWEMQCVDKRANEIYWSKKTDDHDVIAKIVNDGEDYAIDHFTVTYKD